MQEPRLLSVMEAARLLGIGRSTLYLILKDGRLSARKLGKRTLILRDDLETFAQTLPFSEEQR